MSYTPTNWATGDVITAEKLNNMESGIVNAGNGQVRLYLIETVGSNLVGIKEKAIDIWNYINSGAVCFVYFSPPSASGSLQFAVISQAELIADAPQGSAKYTFIFSYLSETMTLIATTDNDYPTVSD